MLSRWLLLFSACLAGSVARGAETNRPPVHMLVPGFTVQELPVKLSNQNNLRFAPDGTLTSLGYDGKVWRLRDTNGDGLEDTAELFWDQPTLSVPLGMAWSTHGLYVSSKGKVSLLRDTNGDGRADTEEVIASGWPATDVGSGGVDATAVALDNAGNVFFGLLVADYSNAYRLRKRSELKPEERAWLQQRQQAATNSPSPFGGERAGVRADDDELVSLYDLNSKRGTIQKFDPRTKRLTTVATGLRVPVALAFNREGDLFNTDQEGETWMPNGNPLDELNHIILGRNYGFPPRHDMWLPNLVSEPPVVGFGPQHQSACGLVFNGPRSKSEVGSREAQFPLPAFPAQGLFGPKWWEGDAFVAGESRGKIWRVRLVKTPHGYVGKSCTIARLDLLTLDLAISPKGDLYVCCHSGPPDWGTGPQGDGKIFKISYTDPKVPQPVAVWPANPTEVRIAFDRPLNPGVADAIRGDSAKIEFGEYVSAGDRFEVLKPPYAVVEQQNATPRGKLAVFSAHLDDGGRELVLRTDKHPVLANYGLTIPVPARAPSGTFDSVDLAYDFSGGEFTMRRKLSLMEQVGRETGVYKQTGIWPSTWSPSIDLRVASGLMRPLRWWTEAAGLLTKGDAEDFEFFTRISNTGSEASVLVASQQKFEIQGDSHRLVARGKATASGFNAKLSMTNSVSESLGLIFGQKSALIEVGTQRSDELVIRPLPLEMTLVTWAPTNRASAGTDSRPAPKPQGDWEHGRELFTGTTLNCAKCHRIRGEGGLAGPDLSNLIHRDARSVERDIREPSATLHPDYVTYLAELKNGDSLTGFIRSQGDDSIRLFDADGKDTVIPRADLTNLHPSGQSLMPTGLLDTLMPADVRDLLTFLLWEPPVRSKAEAERVLAVSTPSPLGGERAGERGNPTTGSKTPSPLPALSPPGGSGEGKAKGALRIVLVASKQDHGPGQHDYPRWQEKWLRLLPLAATNATVEKAWEWPTAEQFATADVLVFYFWNHDWSPARYAQFDAYQQRGGGVVILHSACIADREPEKLAERIGLSATPGTVSYRHMPFDLQLVAKDHPLTRGLPEWLHFLDEPYWPMIGDPSRVTILANGQVDGAPRPLLWTFERGGTDGHKGRVFGSILGHYFWTLDDPFYRLLVLRAIAWAGGADVNRLTDAALVEAAMK